MLYTGKLIEEQEEGLARHLDENLYQEVKLITAHVEEQYGVQHLVSGMRELLHHIGFTF